MGRVDLGRSEGSKAIRCRRLQRLLEFGRWLGGRLGIEVACDLLEDLRLRGGVSKAPTSLERAPTHLSERLGRRTSAVVADMTALLLRHEQPAVTEPYRQRKRRANPQKKVNETTALARSSPRELTAGKLTR